MRGQEVTVASTDIFDMPPTKFDNAECAKLQRESLNCLINNENYKNACQPFFDRYKKSLKDRREREIAERRARLQG